MGLGAPHPPGERLLHGLALANVGIRQEARGHFVLSEREVRTAEATPSRAAELWLTTAYPMCPVEPGAAPARDEHLQEAITELRRGIDALEPVMQMSYHPAGAAVAALHAEAPQDIEPGDADVLAAVAQHLAEWQHNPQNIDQTGCRNRALWRQAVLEKTPSPTVLSQREGPFWV
ncbi:hypothetical protein HET69_12950 [Streptomyces sp. CJ_13]|uniref:hypothetical protein n=1 Tax=Streptomyces sp. CJ_13 TaxID=2724943 RepID=UPI001BDCB7BB|nr:hypothetical protein [Streptomyces sp. CJ_13]MBT1184908.1 hypothetical protein [Streptomyces sp. CJ_13]